MNFTLEINCDNAAFGSNASGELSRILKELSDRVESMGIIEEEVRIRDINGNSVGSFIIDYKEGS